MTKTAQTKATNRKRELEQIRMACLTEAIRTTGVGSPGRVLEAARSFEVYVTTGKTK